MPTAPALFLEAYVETVEQAVAAEQAGADRLELCGPGDGGLTPSAELLAGVRAAVRLPIHAMLRPRSGNFVYDAAEFDEMGRDIPMLRDGGATGLVFGVLQADGRLDITRMRELAMLGTGMRLVCHRAFDVTPDGDKALEQLLALGVHEVLTSGHAPTALEGAAALARYQRAAKGRITILAGGGVRPHNVRALVTQTGVHCVHARAFDAEVIRGIRAAFSA